MKQPLSLALAVAFALPVAASGCDSGADTPSSGGAGNAGTGGSTAAGGAGGTTTTGDSTGAGNSTSTGNTGGAGGAQVDPNCAVPPGASDQIQTGIVAPGLVCTRYPYPLAAPRDVVETEDGQIYVTEMSGGRISRLDATGFVPVAEGLVAPIGLREENATSLLVNEENLHSLSRIDRITGARTQIAAGLNDVTYLARGPDGAAYVSSFQELADTKKGVVWRVDLATGTTLPFATGTNVNEGLFFDPQGQLFLADWLLPSAVYRFPPQGGPVANATQIADGFANIYGLAGDKNGGFYAADHAGKITHVAANGTKTDLVTNIGRPGGLWLAKNGDLLVAEFVTFGATGYLLRLQGL